MSITDQINSIIDQRCGQGQYDGKGHLKAIQSQKLFFDKLKKLIYDYQLFRKEVLRQIKEGKGEYFIMSHEDISFESKVESASPDSLLSNIQKCIEECSRLENRFSRNSINISVIGRARMGKSRLLQSISGLANSVIPASDGGDCTGAKSIIVNSIGEMYTEITFYNEVEMVEHIQKYLDELGINIHLGSLSQINCLKDEINGFEKDMNNKTGREQSLFGHLKKYVNHYDKYNKFVGTKLKETDELKIRSYVAQYDEEGNHTYTFLAVKEVIIFKEFPFAQAGKIVLVDTIGLGDTSLGIRDKMIQTLREDSDAAILVRLPNPKGDGIRVEDDDLYDLICEAMGKDALNKWLFYALNVSDGLNNQNSGIAMEQSLSERQLNYAFIKKVDCSDNQDVENNLLIPILDFISQNLIEVDRELMKNANEFFAKTYSDFYSLVNKVEQIISNNFRKNSSIGSKFDILYSQLPLPSKLIILQNKYKDPRECTIIEDKIKNILKELISAFPEEETIMLRLESGGPESYPANVFNHFADIIRAEISNRFEVINRSTIINLEDAVKNEIITILYSINGGMLSKIPLSRTFEENELCDWLHCFIDERLELYPNIKTAFTSILEYKLNIGGLLEYKVNRSLDYLEPDSEKFPTILFRGISTDNAAVLIEQTLLNTIRDISNTLLESVNDLLMIPYNSFFAQIRKIRERIIFSDEGRIELRDLYRDNCSTIWQEEFMRIITTKEAIGDLNRFCGDMRELCKTELFITNIQ